MNLIMNNFSFFISGNGGNDSGGTSTPNWISVFWKNNFLNKIISGNNGSSNKCPTRFNLSATQITLVNFILKNLSVTVQDLLSRLSDVIGQTVLGFDRNNTVLCLQLDANVTGLLTPITSLLSDIIPANILNAILSNTDANVGLPIGR